MSIRVLSWFGKVYSYSWTAVHCILYQRPRMLFEEILKVPQEPLRNPKWRSLQLFSLFWIIGRVKIYNNNSPKLFFVSVQGRGYGSENLRNDNSSCFLLGEISLELGVTPTETKEGCCREHDTKILRWKTGPQNSFTNNFDNHFDDHRPTVYPKLIFTCGVINNQRYYSKWDYMYRYTSKIHLITWSLMECGG